MDALELDFSHLAISGPRGLGFESRYSDQKRKSTHGVGFLFCGWAEGFERPAPVRRLVQKVYGGHFLDRGRIHDSIDAPLVGVDMESLCLDKWLPFYTTCFNTIKVKQKAIYIYFSWRV